MSNEAVCRTAPATPGLLKTYYSIFGKEYLVFGREYVAPFQVYLS